MFESVQNLTFCSLKNITSKIFSHFALAVRYMSSDEKIEISGELDSTPLIPTETSAKSSIMASWSNISMPGNVGTVLQQQVRISRNADSFDLIFAS